MPIVAVGLALVVGGCGSSSDETSIGDLRDCLTSGAPSAGLRVYEKGERVGEVVSQAGVGGVQLWGTGDSEQAVAVAVERSPKAAARTADGVNEIRSDSFAYTKGDVAVAIKELPSRQVKRLLDECGIGE